MMRCKRIMILRLLAISGAAFDVPYDFAGHFARSGSDDIAICFFRNAGGTMLHAVPFLLAVVVALGLNGAQRAN